jgi:hypothetical protein
LEISDNTIDIHINNDFAFIHSCINGKINICKWLYELSKEEIDIHINNDILFFQNCSNANIEMFEWLVEIKKKPIYIRHFDDYLFKHHCDCVQNHRNGYYRYSRGFLTDDFPSHIKFCKLLVELCEDYYLKIENENIIEWKILNVYNDNKKMKKCINNVYVDKIEDFCTICKLDNHNEMINLGCIQNNKSYDHFYCVECFMKWYNENPKKCLYCMCDIDIKKANLLIIKTNDITL